MLKTITTFICFMAMSVNADIFNGKLDAILDAAYDVQVNPVHMVVIAHKETRFQNVRARAGGTAEGLFQFNDVTWEHVLQRHGHEFNIDLNASKYNVRANSYMGAIYVRENERALRTLLGRTPTIGEVYMSHLLGPTGARRLLSANNNELAVDVVLYAYQRNRPLFLTPSGKQRTVRQFKDHINYKANRLHDRYEPIVVDALMVRNGTDPYKADVDYVFNKLIEPAPIYVALALSVIKDTSFFRNTIVPHVLGYNPMSGDM